MLTLFITQGYRNKQYAAMSVYNNLAMNFFCSWCCKKQSHSIQVYQPLNNTSSLDEAKNQLGVGFAPRQEYISMLKELEAKMLPVNEIKLNLPNSIQALKREAKQEQGVFIKIKKSNYDQIMENCKKTNKNWVDTSFCEVSDENKKGWKIASWKRIKDIIPKAEFMSNPITPAAVLQGQDNDCYWLSAVAALARFDYRVRRLFIKTETNQFGVYGCILLVNGVCQQILVDDFFPIDANGNLIGAKPYKGVDFWNLVLEKCWAKVNNGYERMEFGYNMESLWALTRAPVIGSYIPSRYNKTTEASDNFFNFLMRHYNDNHLITCSVSRANDFKIKTKHSYSILGLFETVHNNQSVRLVQIRNPMGDADTAPEIAYNNDDPFWKAIEGSESDRLEYWAILMNNGSGIFYIDWNSFVLIFTQIAIAQINDNANYLSDTMTIKDKPVFFNINLLSKGLTNFHFIVAQVGRREKKNPDYCNFRLLVAVVFTSYKNQSAYKYISSKSYINDWANLSGLPAGRYFVRFLANTEEEAEFTFGYYSPHDFDVKIDSSVDDGDFVSKTLLSRARSIDQKKFPKMKRDLPKDKAKGWVCIENIRQSNICYIAYHVEASSQSEKYSIQLDETNNITKLITERVDQPSYFMECQLMFEGAWKGEKKVKQVIKRGEEVLIPYTYDIWYENPDLNPSFFDARMMPDPNKFNPL